MKTIDVVALGELLIDFTDSGVSEQGNPVMEANPGGAPCNVLAMLNQLNHSTAFIGKVGVDIFGKQLETALQEVGISTEGLVKDANVRTTLAFVHNLPDGDREFSFYRNPGADMMLSEQELNEDLLRSTKIFHYGSLSMTDECCKRATVKAIAIAREAGAVLTFDPNLRENLWSSLEEAREQILYGMSQCNVLKISDNEITWLTGLESFDDGVAWIQERFPEIALILVSMGKDGSRAYTSTAKVQVAPFIQEHTIETTGAGDTFCGCVLHYILEHAVNAAGENPSKEDILTRIRSFHADNLYDMLRFANGAAALITTRKGALRVMPSREEVEQIL